MKTNLASCGFALLVVGLNWHSTTTVQSDAGTTRTTFDGAGFVCVFCLAALFFLSRSIYKGCRRCLDEGIRVPFSAQLLNLWPCLLLLLMLGCSLVGYTHSAIDGTITTVQQGFGSDQSALALVLAVLTIVAFQFRSRLLPYFRAGQQT